MNVNFKLWRPWILRLHRLCGLSLGGVLALLGLTGSALVIGERWDAALHPEWRVAASALPFAPASSWVSSLQQEQGDSGPRQLRFPAHPEAPVEAWMDAEGNERLYLHPVTARVLGRRSFEHSALGQIRILHYSLAQGSWGEPLVGLCGAALFFFGVSGLVLWWPGLHKLGVGLKLRRPLKGRRAFFDVHKLVGLLALPGLMLAGLTGATLAFSRPLERVLREQGFLAPAAPRRITPTHGTPLPLDVLLARADAALPGARTTRVDFPSSPLGTLRVRKRFPEELHLSGTSFVQVDAVSGAVVWKQDARQAPSAARLLALRFPLHTGTWGGPVSQGLMLLVGLTPAALFFTGLLLWRHRVNDAARARQVLRPSTSERKPYA